MPPSPLRTSAFAAALAAAACASAPTPPEQVMLDAEAASILPAPRADRDAVEGRDLLSQARFWNEEYTKNPNDYEASLKFARVLRLIGSSQRAADIAAQALALKPGDVDLTMVLAQTALDLGRPDLAIPALAAAEGAAGDNWRMLSLIGVVMDAAGQHSGARTYYEKALALAPGNPVVLSNLGLSLALDGRPAEAEEVLRTAVASPGADVRVRQNLSLVLGLQGRFEEAERLIADETPKALLEAQTAYFKALLSPTRRWDDLRARQSPDAG